jgi:hypothetical protein
MKKPFVSTDPNTHQGDNTWFTPKYLIQSLGEFDMDVCTVSWRPFDTALEHIDHDRGQDSLIAPWRGFVFMNPPYGKEILPFIKKFKDHNYGIALVFARMGTQWMQDWIQSGNQIFFLRKRIRFINRWGVTDTNAGTDSCLLVCGEKAIRNIKNSKIEGVFMLPAEIDL